MTEGRTLKPVQRLGPSRFAVMQQCALREVYRGSVTPRLLPSSGAAYLGTVTHQLLEYSATARALTPETAGAKFDALITAAEDRMREGIDRIFVPLAETVPDYGVRRQRAITAAVARSEHASVHTGQTGDRPTAGPELWVQSADGLVGGFVDDALHEPGGVVLRDYKSGTAAAAGTPQHAAAVLQLDLYAALYFESFGAWPAALEIVPITGTPLRAGVDPARSLALLQQASDLVQWVNAVLATTDGMAAETKLAGPTPDVCRTCEFRPLCQSYLRARREAGEWPRDVEGRVVRVARVGNGTATLRMEDGGAQVHIRGLVPDAARHPAFDHLKDGIHAGVFNLGGNRDAKTFHEIAQTTIVVYIEEPWISPS